MLAGSKVKGTVQDAVRLMKGEQFEGNKYKNQSLRTKSEREEREEIEGSSRLELRDGVIPEFTKQRGEFDRDGKIRASSSPIRVLL